MGWFSNRDEAEADTVSADDDGTDETPDGDQLVVPRLLALPASSRARLDEVLADLATRGLDLEDLDAVGASYDAAFAEWEGARASRREEHDRIVERFAIGVGEHIVRHTDLKWGLVTDAFGTDLGIGLERDDFLLVPSNMVAVRWLNGETGWLPGVVRRIVRLRLGGART